MNACVFLITMLLTGITAAQASENIESSLSCVAYLELPTRGLLAARAGASGVITAVIHLGEKGRVVGLDLSGENDTLKREVQISVQLSQFKPECRGSGVRIQYSFKLEEPPTDSIVPPAARYVPPNRFEFTFKRMKPNLEPPASKRTQR